MRVLILIMLVLQACVTPQQQCANETRGQGKDAYRQCLAESYERDRDFADSMNNAAGQMGTISAPRYFRPEPAETHCVTRPNYIGAGYRTDCN